MCAITAMRGYSGTVAPITTGIASFDCCATDLFGANANARRSKNAMVRTLYLRLLSRVIAAPSRNFAMLHRRHRAAERDLTNRDDTTAPANLEVIALCGNVAPTVEAPSQWPAHRA